MQERWAHSLGSLDVSDLIERHSGFESVRNVRGWLSELRCILQMSKWCVCASHLWLDGLVCVCLRASGLLRLIVLM